jgi:Domain of unknown function (DUF4386)
LLCFFNLLSLAVEAVSKLFVLVVMPTLGSPDYLKAFEPQQLQILANFALKSHDIAFNIALIFFGCTCLVNGYLIFRSGYLPTFIGILMQLAGLSYLLACSAALFAPTFADLIIPAILAPALIGESSFCLWLLVKDVNIAKWKERVSMEHGFLASISILGMPKSPIVGRCCSLTCVMTPLLRSPQYRGLQVEMKCQ